MISPTLAFDEGSRPSDHLHPRFSALIDNIDLEDDICSDLADDTSYLGTENRITNSPRRRRTSGALRLALKSDARMIPARYAAPELRAALDGIRQSGADVRKQAAHATFALAKDGAEATTIGAGK